MNSINTNVGAMVALRNLNAISAELIATQNRISTGLKVASAKDNGAVWAMAQTQRSEVSGLDAVKESLSRNSSVVDIALTAGESVSDMLIELKEKVLAASETSLSTTSRNALKSDFGAIKIQITRTLQNARFNGINLLDGSRSAIYALANARGSDSLTVAAQNMSFGGSILTFSAGASFTSATAASGLLSTLESSINNVSAALSRLGTSSQSLDRHATFIGKIQDTMIASIGRMVDADLAKESAKFQALQVKQQLVIQSLAIANQAPSYLLKLFGR